MSQAEDIQAAIAANATGPKKASGDAGSMEQHSLLEQIAAAKHIASQQAAKTPSRGVRFSVLTPPGAV